MDEHEGVERGLALKVTAEQVRESGLQPESSGDPSSRDTGKQRAQGDPWGSRTGSGLNGSKAVRRRGESRSEIVPSSWEGEA